MPPTRVFSKAPDKSILGLPRGLRNFLEKLKMRVLASTTIDKQSLENRVSSEAVQRRGALAKSRLVAG